jgi:hypothetical protein
MPTMPETAVIADGTRLIVTTASGGRLLMIATGRPVRGRDFPVVWVCRPSDHGKLDVLPTWASIPWPLDSVELADAE